MAGKDVTRQAAEVEKIQAEIKASQDGGDVATAVGEPSTTLNEPQPQETPPVPPVGAEAVPPLIVDTENSVDALQHKISVLEGKLDKEVPRLVNENKLLTSKISDLNETVSGYAEQGNAPAPEVAPVVPDAPNAIEFTEEEVTAWGEEGINMFKKAAQSIAEPAIFALEQRLEQRITGVVNDLMGQLNTVTTKQETTAENRLGAKLDSEYPGWDNIINSEAFSVWAQGTYIPLTNTTYWDSIGLAAGKENSGDIVGIINAYNNYIGVSREIVPAVEPGAQQLPNQGEVSPANSLIEPERAISAGADGSIAPEAEIITAADVAKNYEDARKGILSDEDLAVFQAKFVNAQKTGNYQP